MSKKTDDPQNTLTRRGLLGSLTATSLATLVGTVHAAGHASPPGGRPMSDYMVDVLRSLKIEYVTANPSSALRGLHESIINYGRNRQPELLTVTHEEIGVAMAHGWFKACGKPMATMVHGAVGTQHAAMAVFNAWCDRVPVVVISGNETDASHRPPGVPTVHAVQDGNGLLRDFTKWDDAPVSAAHFGLSMVRAYKLAMTPPFEPVALSLDAGLQESMLHDTSHLSIPRYVATAPPQGDANAVRDAARLLAGAERPVIVADRAARTPAGIALLVQLAEALEDRKFNRPSASIGTLASS